MSKADKPRRSDLGFCCLAIALTVVALSVVAMPLAYGVSSWIGVRQALVAAGLCLATGIGAMVLVRWASRIEQPLIGMLGAMAIRMLPPLVVCLVLGSGDANARGDYGVFIASLLAYYLATLAVETWLSVGAASNHPFGARHG